MSASMNDVKTRMKSVQSTMQITKAMELVATSKLRRAKERAENSRPFYEAMTEALVQIAKCEGVGESVFTKPGEGKTLFIMIAGDRGLAGGYNANIFRMTEQLAKGVDAVYLPIGKKALEYCRYRNYPIYMDLFDYVSIFGMGDAVSAAQEICASFLKREITKVVLIYTKFVSMLSQVPVYEEILPLTLTPQKSGIEPIFEGEAEDMMAAIVPDYVGGILYAAKSEAEASESGARRSAMNAANKNAEEMITGLMLQYNRARQAIITQEITEIVSGAEAL